MKYIVCVYLSQAQEKEHLLKETETTMKFGLFCMVQGYLHSMQLVQREKSSWSGQGDVIGKDLETQYRAPQTSERKKMVQVRYLSRQMAKWPCGVHEGGGRGEEVGGGGSVMFPDRYGIDREPLKTRSHRRAVGWNSGVATTNTP